MSFNVYSTSELISVEIETEKVQLSA